MWQVGYEIESGTILAEVHKTDSNSERENTNQAAREGAVSVGYRHADN